MDHTEQKPSQYLRRRRRTLYEACVAWALRKGLESTPCNNCTVRDYCQATRGATPPLTALAKLRPAAGLTLTEESERSDVT